MMNEQDMGERAWDLYRQLQAQRARVNNYAESLAFVRVRQMENRSSVEPIARKLWEIAERVARRHGCDLDAR